MGARRWPLVSNFTLEARGQVGELTATADYRVWSATDADWEAAGDLDTTDALVGADGLAPRHCFRSLLHRDPQVYHDEHSNVVSPPEPGLPVGMRALGGYTIIDLDISRALGIPHEYDEFRRR